MVLIGCKTDLRKDKEQLRKLRAAQLEPITYTQVGKGASHGTGPGSPNDPSQKPPRCLTRLLWGAGEWLLPSSHANTKLASVGTETGPHQLQRAPKASPKLLRL